ncbi:SDR family oxidoreductase [Candidatus Clostridium radicumherbarum]|uniref:dTDP-4-dehydrorhamnose reductase n=1 Tax=Candidatus Clostridium radicumherbarum TaxID=3381662 RepID=A0ABW8TSA6_9CLOT
MDKILVTGASGFLASRFCEYYKSKYDITALKKSDLDIRDEKKVSEIFKSLRPQYVLHTAAIADTAKCEEDKAASYDINVTGSINIAKACNLVKTKMINLSTEQIFNGNIEAGPYSEKTEPIPNTTYGQHKLTAEKEIEKILEDKWILRLTWIFGVPERFRKVNPNILWNVVAASISGNKILVPSHEYRGMTYVYDLLKNIEKIMEIPYGTYHTGSENDLSTFDIAEVIVKKLGISHRLNEIIVKDDARYNKQQRDIRITNKKLKKLGIDFLNTEEAISLCIKEFNLAK